MTDRERELCAQVEELTAQLQQMKRERAGYLIDRAVIALMTESDNPKFDRELFARISGVQLHGNRFVVCAFTDEHSEPGTMDEAPIWESLNSTYYYTLSDLIRPQFASQSACVTANCSGCIYALVNLSDTLSPEGYYEAFRQMCMAVNDAVEQAEGFRFQICVSPIGYGLDSLPTLRKNVTMLCEYRQLVGRGLAEVLFFRDVAQNGAEELPIVASRADNEQFSDYINRGDFALAKAYFHAHMVGHMLESVSSVTMLRFRIAGLIDYTLQTLTRASRELGLTQVLDGQPIGEELLNAQSLEELTARMDELLDALAEQWNTECTASQLLAVQARGYIDANYADCTLNVNMVSENFGVTASHLTRVFQVHFQIRVLDYIQTVRLRAAKDLLGSGLTLRQIAEQVGYGAQINMLRAFKRLEGKTPTEFMK